MENGAFRRRREALRLRRQGLTFKEVGARLGVGPARASDLVKFAERLESFALFEGRDPDQPSQPRPRSELAVLPMRAQIRLKSAGMGDLDSVREAFLRDSGRELLSLVGMRCTREIAEVIGLSALADERWPRRKVVPKRDRLAAAVELLRQNGYTVTPPK